MKIIAFGGSSSKQSINKQLATYAAHFFGNAEVEILDLNDYPLPLFSIDKEQESGLPENVLLFYQKIASADLVVLSLAEHNGSYTAAFKNLIDWLSRHDGKFFQSKRVFLLSTSPGGRGGQNVMDAALTRFPFHDAVIVGHFSLPFFDQHFDAEKGITNDELREKFTAAVAQIKMQMGE